MSKQASSIPLCKSTPEISLFFSDNKSGVPIAAYGRRYLGDVQYSMRKLSDYKSLNGSLL